MNTADVTRHARKFAEIAHAGVTRKVTAEPFFNHPMRVAEMMRADGCSNTIVAAAYLHDVLEDTEQEIGHFPGRVREIVARLTKRDGESKMDHVLRIGRSMDRAAILIKCADRIDNIKDGADALGKKWLRNYLKHTKELLRLARENGLGDCSVVIRLDLDLLKNEEATR